MIPSTKFNPESFSAQLAFNNNYIIAFVRGFGVLGFWGFGLQKSRNVKLFFGK